MFVRQGVEDGSIGIAPKEVDGCIVTENMPMFSIEGIDSEFLDLIIKSKQFQEEVSKITTTGSAQKSIHERQLLEIEFLCPNRDKQRQIVNSFVGNKELNSLLESELSTQTNIVNQLRKAFLREAMQGKIVLQDNNDEPASELLKRIKAEKEKLIAEGKIKKQKPLPEIKPEEIPYEIPESWIWCRVSEVAEHCLGKMLDAGKNKGTLQPYLRNINIRWLNFDFSCLLKMRFEEKEEERYGLNYGDILICEGGEPGRAAIWQNQIPNMKIQKAIHRVRFYKGIDNKYFLLYLFLSARSKYLDSYFTGAGIKHFTGKSLARFLIPLPPLAEQQRIVTKLEQLMQLCSELEKTINQSKEETNLLLQTVLREALEEKEK
ncbi:MAG: restriction endonuclease subunit S [Ignavibacteria bacterium]|nr:restriction endonuclease subunit S [Ignavibacteria bacterium]